MTVRDHSETRRPGSTWLALGLGALLWLGLVAALPYATGYGADRQPLAYWLWYFWRDPDWQHGALVLPILAVLTWRQRECWLGEPANRPPVAGSWWGLGLVAFACFAYFVGYRANIYYFGFAAAQLLIAGLVVWLAGWRWFGRVLFFWCLLGFLWPLYFLESRLGFPLRMLMTDVSAGLLDLFSVEHLRRGTALLSLPDAGAGLAAGDRFALEVASPCSGLRSLFALTMVGALFGYLSLGKTWQWLTLMLSAVPLAVIGNVVRILLLLVASRLFGSEFAIGVDGDSSGFHLFAGLAVFLVALAGMSGLASGLRAWDRRAQQRIGLKQKTQPSRSLSDLSTPA